MRAHAPARVACAVQSPPKPPPRGEMSSRNSEARRRLAFGLAESLGRWGHGDSPIPYALCSACTPQPSHLGTARDLAARRRPHTNSLLGHSAASSAQPVSASPIYTDWANRLHASHPNPIHNAPPLRRGAATHWPAAAARNRLAPRAQASERGPCRSSQQRDAARQRDVSSAVAWRVSHGRRRGPRSVRRSLHRRWCRGSRFMRAARQHRSVRRR